MDEAFCGLQSMIRALCGESRVHICIHDVAGVLYAPELRLDSAYRFHSAKFCNLAKDTPRGFSLCLRCKTRANKKAITQRKAFSGYCPYGLYELAWPVVAEGEVVCVIYIGNLLPDETAALRRLQPTAALTGCSAAALTGELRHAQRADSLAPYERIASALDSYIRLLLSHLDWKKQKWTKLGCRRKALEAAEYIDANFNRDISLRQLAALYFVSEKYLGQVFRAEMGETMRQYLNRVRLEHAARLLETGEQPVVNVALDCGFQNVPYFNRLFMEQYHQTPLAYRRKHRADSPAD